jgi:hypothetical protein
VRCPTFWRKISTEIQKQNFYFLTYDDKDYNGEYGKNNSIIWELKHSCFSIFRMAFFFFAISPDGGVEMPHCGRVSCLTYFPCFFFSNKLLTTGIVTVATHSAQLMKPLAAVHNLIQSPFCSVVPQGAHNFAGTGCFWFIFTSWFWFIIPRFIFTNASHCFSTLFKELQTFFFFGRGSPLTLW